MDYQKLLDQAPGLAGTIIIALAFLKYLGRRDKDWRRMHEEHLESRAMDRTAISDNTEAMERQTQAVCQLSLHIQTIKNICPLEREQRTQRRPPPRE